MQKRRWRRRDRCRKYAILIILFPSRRNLSFSDTLVALRIMRSQFPQIDKTRHLIDPSMYCFAIPNIGSIMKGLSKGRKELLSFLNCRTYKEMMLAPLDIISF
ncbi:uncharacterized protein LOC111314323 [Durio zibethinus]|uniref:Uncharacterized protein LOC111314323 n=1 Tax=Durio zibethinus TaxID=66656 RepID=A0A6P6B2A1_DURZI|nr:uncharacterized protein LOC111314323 [Durio zibethinus]